MRLSIPNNSSTLLVTLGLMILTAIVSSAALIQRRVRNPVSRPGETSLLTTSQARESYGNIPLSFEVNQGQTDRSVDFLARGAGYTLFLKPTEAVLALRSSDCGIQKEDRAGDSHGTDVPPATGSQQSAICNSEAKVLRMTLLGADPGAAADTTDELAGKVNYFNGDDAKQWRTNVPTFARVRYREVYPGVDMIYYGNQRQLEYDFHVAPGTDPRTILLKFAGADKLEVDKEGDLLLTMGHTVVSQPKPYIYQEVAGMRRAIEGGYVIREGGRVGFAIGKYDPQNALIIDPTLVYSTYLGGNAADEANDVKVDSAGNAYICGNTASTNFPTANAFQGMFGGGNFAGARDGFVTKINAAGTAVVYSTYLGGAGDDRCNKIAVDSNGNAYLGGETTSINFPTANAFQATFRGGVSDAFVTKLNAAGSGLIYSTYLGGGIFDAADAITIDGAGAAYVTGRTTSTNFPTVNSIQSAFSGGSSADLFITKFNTAGSALLYSTYLGGNGGGGFDAPYSIALDSGGSAYITGQTTSTNFPTANAIQGTFGGGTPDGDAFVTKINPAGSALVYSTYLGGSNNDIGFEIALDSAGNAFVAGTTFSTNFPTANPFQNTLSGISDGFVTRLNTAGSALTYSTYLGGLGDESCNGIAVDFAGNVYVVGGTSSATFPVVNAPLGNYSGAVDGFVTKISPAGSGIFFSTYLGGSGSDAALAVALDTVGGVYVVGRTTSTSFPTVNPIQNSSGSGGTNDAFVTKLSDPSPAGLQFSQASYPVTEDVTFVTIAVVRNGDPSAAVTVDYTTFDGTAFERFDYTTALGTLRFAAGETVKTFVVLINEDSFGEGPESLSVTLSNPTGGASIGPQTTATIQISDDASEPATNVIDDSTIFVGTHYHDFLNRQADSSGLTFWVNQIESCGNDSQCRDVKRINVSTAFFLSIEFQQTGFEVIRLYKASFTSPSRPRGLPRYREFLKDTQEVQRGVVVGVGNWEQQLNDNKTNFAIAWVQRPEFLTEFPLTMTADQYINKLFANSEVAPTLTEFNIAFDAYNNGGTQGRAQALLAVVRSGSVINKQFNPAFVVMQYIGYLRRNPNDAPEPGLNYDGFDFWLAKLNQFSVAGEDVRNQQVALARAQRAEMVKAFMTSGEYGGRFGP